jgi:hypothetical protein
VAGNAKAFGELGKIITAAGRVASGETVKSSVRVMGATVFNLTRASIAAGKNAGGGAWKKRADGTRPVFRGARLAIRETAQGFTLVLPPLYKFHQAGAYRPSKTPGGKGWRLPKRRLVPARRRLAKAWRVVVVAALNAEWSRTWR